MDILAIQELIILLKSESKWDAVINISEIVNSSLELSQEEIEPDSLNLKYYLIYGDYRLNIYKKNYLGTSSEIRGSMVLTKGKR